MNDKIEQLIKNAILAEVINPSDKIITAGSNQCGIYVKFESGTVLMSGTTAQYPCATTTVPVMFGESKIESIGKWK